MKLAICNELFENWPWEGVCDFVRSTGYRGIEVAPFTLAERAERITPQQRTELRAAAESRGRGRCGSRGKPRRGFWAGM